jgi:hypothetical protein
VPAQSEEILDGIVDGEKSLGVLSRFESAHLPFPLTGRLMRGFDSIVGEPLHTVSHVAEDSSHGSGVASQFVGSDPQWFDTLTA